MHDQHVTHLLTRYVHGQLSVAQQARVAAHARACFACRMALNREQELASRLRREIPRLGQVTGGQLASVWSSIWQEIDAPRGHTRSLLSAGLTGLSVVLAMMLVLVIALPMISGAGVRAEGAPSQPRPLSTASPTPGASETSQAAALPDPRATVAYAVGAGATPAPVPQTTVSPSAPVLSGFLGH